MTQGLAHDERVVGRGHHSLVLGRIRENWALILRVVLFDVLLVWLLRQCDVLLFEWLPAIRCKLCLNVSSVLVVVGSLLLLVLMVFVGAGILVHAHLLL